MTDEKCKEKTFDVMDLSEQGVKKAFERLEEIENSVKLMDDGEYCEGKYLSLDNGKYCICIDRIDNPIKLIWWIHHLNKKDWFKREHVERLIEVATEAMGIKMYQGQG
jgi:hypothetical protein